MRLSSNLRARAVSSEKQASKSSRCVLVCLYWNVMLIFFCFIYSPSHPWCDSFLLFAACKNSHGGHACSSLPSFSPSSSIYIDCCFLLASRNDLRKVTDCDGACFFVLFTKRSSEAFLFPSLTQRSPESLLEQEEEEEEKKQKKLNYRQARVQLADGDTNKFDAFQSRFFFRQKSGLPIWNGPQKAFQPIQGWHTSKHKWTT